MSKLCGLVLGFFVLIAAVATAAEPAETTTSAGPTLSGEPAIQPVSLSLAEKSLNEDARATAEDDEKKRESAAAAKVEPEKSNQKNTAKTNESEKPKKPKPLKRRVIVVKATWCGACQSLNYEWPKLRKVRWRIGSEKTNHFQVIDTDQDPGVVGRYGVTQLPTLLLVEDGKVIKRSGTLNAKNLAEFYYGRL